MICRKVLMRMIPKIPLWILFRWSCSRISVTSWRSMRIRRGWRVKKLRATDREMTTPLLLLRAVQLGVQIGEMNLLTIGTINDMYTEMQNDENQGSYSTLASQDDMDRF